MEADTGADAEFVLGQRFDAAIVDLDGTLVDTMGDFVAALQAMLLDLPAPFSSYVLHANVVEPFVGKGSENLIKDLLVHINKSQKAINNLSKNNATQNNVVLFEQAWQSYQKHYQAVNGHHAQVYPGAKEGLRQMQRLGLRMACVTNKPTAFATELLRLKGLDIFFELTLGGDTFEHKKPHPMPLLKACEALGTTPYKTLMVGDSSNDAQAARAAGCQVLLVTYGYNHGAPVRGVDSDAFTDTLTQIPWATWKF
jgi:phosphoglycolate phosphatase